MSKRNFDISAGIFQPILSLTLMCDSVTLDSSNPLMAAIVGPGLSLLNIDPRLLGLKHTRATHPQLVTMVLAALEFAQDSDVLQQMPPICEGIEAVQLVATFFLYSMESPFPLFVTPPLETYVYPLPPTSLLLGTA